MNNPITDDIFIIQGESIAVLPRDYMATSGVAPTVDAEGNILNNGLYDIRTVGVSISRMAEIVMNGFTFRILETSDIEIIYKICIDFITEHRRINSIGLYSLFSNEFIDMIENFKDEIFKKHREYLNEVEPVRSFNTIQDVMIYPGQVSKEEPQEEVRYINHSAIGLFKG